jgi:hypothetical protein
LVSTRLYIYTLAPIHCPDLGAGEGEGDLLHRIRWHEGSVVLEKERGGDLWNLAHDLRTLLCFLGFDFAFGLVLLDSRVVLADQALYLEEGSVLRIFEEQAGSLQRRICESSLRFPS